MRSRRAVTLGLLLACRTAHADPVVLELHNVVAAGKKPSITVSAIEALSDVVLDIERLDDHRTFHTKLGPIAAGGHAELSIGDGKAGRARWEGKLVVHAKSGESRSAITFESSVGGGAGQHVTYDRAHLDVEHGRLQFQISKPASRASLVVVGEDGTPFANVEKLLEKERANQWIAIEWPPEKTVVRLELTIATEGGDSVIVKLVPWSVSIPHEEVVFASGASDIRTTEVAKLDASYQKIVDAVANVRRVEPSLDVRVYVAGHTDTVGGSDDNRTLSLARAKAICAWFKERGLPLPLYYAGFGEDRLRVKTADDVDEARNRRADYVVGVEAPASGRYTELR